MKDLTKDEKIAITAVAAVVIILLLLWTANGGSFDFSGDDSGAPDDSGSGSANQGVPVYQVDIGTVPAINITQAGPTYLNYVGCPCVAPANSVFAGAVQTLMNFYVNSAENFETNYLNDVQNALPAYMSQMVNNWSGAIGSANAAAAVNYGGNE